ncbi:MAG TPA: translation elongation factor 4 [Spirochaetota bacterium]|jgi:GTP-binding protein LepA|nr:translation elongation factor 4 [Spirochaetota bacterium]OQA99460.1 MAG: Elongation factor 4 [Spirochaetes bacterium ADurb.Bin218]HOK01609.1 translation elongation factor 4 [Spirochaetota bacterium]HOK91379.1 translation elongation factor 4 [Spirochaetota bacterium]HOQ12966.1 translation elongation factor 4 [Spirochaetota bacterium]
MNLSHIRNFSIIAHIDHGKSTLADRIIEKCRLVNERNKKDQILDTMDIERERGITIKSNAITLNYTSKSGEEYIFNLIDTPGHVDFTYEVSRALSSCDGVILIVDATQGVEAQTIANFYLALENDLEILPVINKIDMPSADIENTKSQLDKTLGLDPEMAVLTSAKEGIGIDELLEKVIEVIPPPKGDVNSPLKALIFDSFYDQYLGAVIKVRIFDGSVKKDDVIKLFATGKEFTVTEVGIFRLDLEKKDILTPGEVGYIVAGIKSVVDTKIGDTVTLAKNPAKEPLKGFKEVKSMVFSGLYPMYSDDYENLRDALYKLQLNDASLIFEPDNSYALGFGFRCGYLGLLHMEIVQERLEREFGLSLITTAPSVEFKVLLINGKELKIDNPVNMPDPGQIERIEEPYVSAAIVTPTEYVGNIMQLVTESRGIHKNMEYITPQRVQLTYELPLSEIVFNFYDKLKSISRGYASFDYDFLDYRPSDMVKVDILVNGEPVDALSFIVHRDKARTRGKEIIEKLKEIIPRHQFKIPLQAAIGATIIARENISAVRKDVTAKCYGGDITRKRKLLEKQKEGKKRMKMIGSVEIPQEAFLTILKID